MLFSKILKPVQGDSNLFVIPNCLGFCFTKSRCSLHFVVVRLTFCSLVSTLPLRTTQNPLVLESVYLQNLLNIVETDSSGDVVLDFRVVDFLDFTLRLCLCHSVENLLLTSSLAWLDSTLPKIRQNDKYYLSSY